MGGDANMLVKRNKKSSKVLFVIHSGVAERDASSKVSWLNPKELILSRI